jgi:[ribosomal protein S5]-alanine N-acetyltransferase
MTVFETARLRIRHLLPSDAEALFAICRDPVTMQWMGDGQPLSFEQCQKWIEISQRNYASHGFGVSAVELHGQPGMIGFCGLVYAPDSAIPEIIYAFGPSWWGHGYASEVATAMLAYGFAHGGLNRIMATIDPQNLGSCRVVEKAGMHFERSETDTDGLPMQVYFIDRPSAG